ncbi:extensin-like [Gigantopelta aegis]|uniref:extensin-like n=1 Tax=Gigantopelta aegis TaxID=1735272 RepID=UPI001B88CF5E|nr:extensin-like [Gigantopelta aegis]
MHIHAHVWQHDASKGESTNTRLTSLPDRSPLPPCTPRSQCAETTGITTRPFSPPTLHPKISVRRDNRHHYPTVLPCHPRPQDLIPPRQPASLPDRSPLPTSTQDLSPPRQPASLPDRSPLPPSTPRSQSAETTSITTRPFSPPTLHPKISVRRDNQHHYPTVLPSHHPPQDLSPPRQPASLPDRSPLPPSTLSVRPRHHSYRRDTPIRQTTAYPTVLPSTSTQDLSPPSTLPDRSPLTLHPKISVRRDNRITTRPPPPTLHPKISVRRDNQHHKPDRSPLPPSTPRSQSAETTGITTRPFSPPTLHTPRSQSAETTGITTRPFSPPTLHPKISVRRDNQHHYPTVLPPPSTPRSQSAETTGITTRPFSPSHPPPQDLIPPRQPASLPARSPLTPSPTSSHPPPKISVRRENQHHYPTVLPSHPPPQDLSPPRQPASQPDRSPMPPSTPRSQSAETTGITTRHFSPPTLHPKISVRRDNQHHNPTVLPCHPPPQDLSPPRQPASQPDRSPLRPSTPRSQSAETTGITTRPFSPPTLHPKISVRRDNRHHYPTFLSSHPPPQDLIPPRQPASLPDRSPLPTSTQDLIPPRPASLPDRSPLPPSTPRSQCAETTGITTRPFSPPTMHPKISVRRDYRHHYPTVLPSHPPAQDLNPPRQPASLPDRSSLPPCTPSSQCSETTSITTRPFSHATLHPKISFRRDNRHHYQTVLPSQPPPRISFRRDRHHYPTVLPSHHAPQDLSAPRLPASLPDRSPLPPSSPRSESAKTTSITTRPFFPPTLHTKLSVLRDNQHHYPTVLPSHPPPQDLSPPREPASLPDRSPLPYSTPRSQSAETTSITTRPFSPPTLHPKISVLRDNQHHYPTVLPSHPPPQDLSPPRQPGSLPDRSPLPPSTPRSEFAETTSITTRPFSPPTLHPKISVRRDNRHHYPTVLPSTLHPKISVRRDNRHHYPTVLPSHLPPQDLSPPRQPASLPDRSPLPPSTPRSQSAETTGITTRPFSPPTLHPKISVRRDNRHHYPTVLPCHPPPQDLIPPRQPASLPDRSPLPTSTQDLIPPRPASLPDRSPLPPSTQDLSPPRQPAVQSPVQSVQNNES